MSTYTGSNNQFTLYKKKLLDDYLSGKTFKIMFLSSSWTPAINTNQYVSDISTYEVTTNGAARQTTTLSTSVSGSTVTLDATDVALTASGGSIVFRYWVLYEHTGTDSTSAVMHYGYGDETPADITVTDGNTYDLVVNTSGLATY